ncbi:cloroquine resistance asscociatd protein Cg7 [Plasmodium vivax India VII]|uniref:Cloroquine resistance asscociatd protein Cg7 n=1 Tax=Plasmodium vivax India VII TaxID=1077284 RepID=A0A0J9SJJ0_PLAVI|nr:cloroquine resistance asscociatd protein Cg7 [Plasmodium vivax India VII]
METEEIVCVHVTLKFVIFKSIKKNENSRCNNFIINLAEANDIEAANKSKQYFIQKFHQILKKKKKKKNEYECLLNGTVTEIATFLAQHMELYIQISQVRYEAGEQSEGGGPAGEGANLAGADGADGEPPPPRGDREREPNRRTSPGRNKIHLLKSVDLVEDDIQFENGQIYFKCVFKDLLSDFEFIHHRRYENISNFYVSNDFIFSISVKFEECLLGRRDLERRGARGSAYEREDRYEGSYDGRYEDRYDGRYEDRYDGHHNHRYDHRYDDRYAGRPRDRRAGKYWHLVNLCHMTNLFYLHVNFEAHEQSFFRHNCVEVTVGDMLQSLSPRDAQDGTPSGANRNESGFASPGGGPLNGTNDNHHRDADDEQHRDADDGHHPLTDGSPPMGCHFSLTLIDHVEELYDYFRLNDIHIIFNKIQLEVEKKGPFFSHHKKSGDLWVRYKDMERMTCQLSTVGGSVPSLTFQATIMSICLLPRGGESGGRFFNSWRWRRSDGVGSDDVGSGDVESGDVESGDGVGSSRTSGSGNSPSWGPRVRAHRKELGPPKDHLLKWNLFLSVERCHILELSNIYAEKRKTRQSDFFVKVESGLLARRFVSPFYPFEENRQIELKNCHLSHDFQRRGADPCDQLEGEAVHFHLALREEHTEGEGPPGDPHQDIGSGINIGVGELSLKNLSKELKTTLMKERGGPPQRDYYQFEFCVPLYLHVFKEKYLTSELSVRVFLSARREGEAEGAAKVGSPEEETLTVDESGDHLVKYTPKEGTIPSNIYEFKLWKEEEERRMAEMLKRKEQNVIKKLMKKLIKKYEDMERERKNEMEKKKNELKEIVIKVKEEQINVKKNENLIKLKDKQLNDEIYTLEKKLKKIKHAYEKSLTHFKKNLRKAHLGESLVKENDQLVASYKNALSKVKRLSKENEEMKTLLGKYNSRDNAIISNAYFEELKEELKRLKLFHRQTVQSRGRSGEAEGGAAQWTEAEGGAAQWTEAEGEAADGGAPPHSSSSSYIRTVRKNRKRIIQLVGNFVPQIEEIYDLTNDDLLEEKVRSILRDVHEVRLILRAEAKELDRASPGRWRGESSDGSAGGAAGRAEDRVAGKSADRSAGHHIDVYTGEFPEPPSTRTDPSRTRGRNLPGKAPPLGRHASLASHPRGKKPPPQRSLLRGKGFPGILSKGVDIPSKAAVAHFRGVDSPSKGVYAPTKGLSAHCREAPPHAKLLSEKRGRAPPKDSAPTPQTDGFRKRDKPNDNASVIENLKSEIKRLIETGIYNEDDTIIQNMKRKLSALL